MLGFTLWFLYDHPYLITFLGLNHQQGLVIKLQEMIVTVKINPVVRAMNFSSCYSMHKLNCGWHEDSKLGGLSIDVQLPFG